MIKIVREENACESFGFDKIYKDKSGASRKANNVATFFENVSLITTVALLVFLQNFLTKDFR